MPPVATDVARYSRGLCVCMMGTCCAKTAEPIELPFVMGQRSMY